MANGRLPTTRSLWIIFVVSNCVGYSLHLLFFLGGCSVEETIRRAGRVVVTLYCMGIGTVGVIAGFWLSMLVLGRSFMPQMGQPRRRHRARGPRRRAAPHHDDRRRVRAHRRLPRGAQGAHGRSPAGRDGPPPGARCDRNPGDAGPAGRGERHPPRPRAQGGKYTCVVTRDGELLIRTALSDLAKQLDPATFAQVHRSTLLNLHFVASTRRDLGGRVFVRLKDARRTELPVSRACAHLFRQM